ncbi:hypothetical protein K1719_001459 [Acacia pycnantha]|nr:hypothetical protein K1719_001459 [Acacia pycnantha]
MAMLDSLDADMAVASSGQRLDASRKQEFIRSSGSFLKLNLVDPMSAAASPIGGIPLFGRLYGDIYICKHCVIGETIRPIGGMAVVLALVEAAETRDMLHTVWP